MEVLSGEAEGLGHRTGSARGASIEVDRGSIGGGARGSGGGGGRLAAEDSDFANDPFFDSTFTALVDRAERTGLAISRTYCEGVEGGVEGGDEGCHGETKA